MRDTATLHQLRQHDVATRFDPHRPPSCHLVFDRDTPEAVPPSHPDEEGLSFGASGPGMNLWRAYRVTEWEYDLLLSEDLGTRFGAGSTGWFYFEVKNAEEGAVYKLNILTLTLIGGEERRRRCGVQAQHPQRPPLPLQPFQPWRPALAV